MIQILGNDLEQAIKDYDIKATLKYKTNRDDLDRFDHRFEVWELTEEERIKIDSIDEDVWLERDYGWYRFGERNTDPSGVPYIVNGHEMLGYEPWVLDEEDEDEEVEDNTNEPEKFKHFMQYLEEVENLSSDLNIAVTAITLARYNGLTLAEFMARYY